MAKFTPVLVYPLKNLKGGEMVQQLSAIVTFAGD